MIAEWKASLSERVSEWGLPAGGQWRVLLCNNHHIDLLWFHNGDKSPAVVTKISREEGTLKHEYESLEYLHSAAPHLAPRPFALEKHRNYSGVWREGVSGVPLFAEQYSLKTVHSLVDMVAAMHGAICARGAQLVPNRYQRAVDDPLETLSQYAKDYANDSLMMRGCAALRAEIRPEAVNSWRVMPQHGDLFPGNILSSNGQWRVIDWENFGVVDFPFYDLLMLLISLLQGDAASPEAWDAVLLKQLPSLVKQYATSLDLSSSQVEMLLPLTLVNWFHYQWSTGRDLAVRRTYGMMEHYFEHSALWRRAFLG